VSPYLRTVKTSSGATAVQIVYSSRRGSREIDHLGSAHDDAGVELLKAAARQRLAAGQGELDLGLQPDADAGGPQPITSSRMGHLWDALACGYAVLGLEQAAGGDEVFRDLVLARIIEPTSKLDSARVLEEAGTAPASYPTVNRRLRVYARDSWRQKLSAACAAHAGLGPASLVLYDVSTLYFETDAGDGFREPGFSKERRLEPQITIGLLADSGGFPLMVSAFEGNKAETTTMLPVIEAFMQAHQLPDVTVVADAGMVSAANQKAIEDAGLSFILGARIPDVAPRAPRGGDPGRAHLHPAMAGRPGGQPPRPGHLLPVQGRPGPPDLARDRRAGRQGREGRRRPGRRKAEPVRPAVRRHQENQPAAGRKGPGPGRAKGIRHQPAGLSRRHPGHGGVRDQRQPLDRDHHRLEHQEIRPHRPPLPHHPGRPPHQHRRRPRPRRPPGSPGQHQQRRPRCALA